MVYNGQVNTAYVLPSLVPCTRSYMYERVSEGGIDGCFLSVRGVCFEHVFRVLDSCLKIHRFCALTIKCMCAALHCTSLTPSLLRRFVGLTDFCADFTDTSTAVTTTTSASPTTTTTTTTTLQPSPPPPPPPRIGTLTCCGVEPLGSVAGCVRLALAVAGGESELRGCYGTGVL